MRNSYNGSTNVGAVFENPGRRHYRICRGEMGNVLWSVLDWWHQGAKVPTRKSTFGDGDAAEQSVKILQDAGYT